MNRQLKFRIWDKQNKNWLKNSSSFHCYSNWTICPFSGKLVDYVGDYGCDSFTSSPAADYYFEGAEIVKEPRYVIQQYTGLKDSKGVEIYEGDILEYQSHDPKYAKCIVRWTQEHEDNHPSFVIHDSYSQYGKPEVIGNVMQTLELIKNHE